GRKTLPVPRLVCHCRIAQDAGNRRECRPAVEIMDVDALARPVGDRVVRPGRDLVVATVAAPCKAGAFGRHMESGALIGDDVDPRLWSHSSPGETYDIMPTVALEAAEPVPVFKPLAVRGNAFRKEGGNLLSRVVLWEGRRIMGREFIPRLQCGGLGTLDLIEYRAVAGMQHNPGHGQQRTVSRLVHEVASHSEYMLARAEFLATQPAVLAKRLDGMLQVLNVGRSLLIDDDQVDHHPACAHIFLEAQRLGNYLKVRDVGEANDEDRIVAGNRRRPHAGRIAKP